MRGLRVPAREEHGAIAVIVALLSLVLFACAALAVDFGNVWSRERDVQKQVDVAALSAGYLLPQTSTNKGQIADEVAKYLNENPTVGQAGNVTGAILLNGITADGEVTFHDNDGGACTTDCTRMKVIAPVADVDFFLAGALGFNGASVTRDASVRVLSALPPSYDMLPFWLPSGCALGPAQADTDGGTSGGGAPTPAPTTSAPTSSAPTSGGTSGTSSPSPSPSASPTFNPGLTVGTHVLNGTSPVTVGEGTSRTMSGLTITNHQSNIDRASIRFYAPDGSWFIDYAAQTVKKPGSVLSVPPFQVGTEVTDYPGDWKVYALVQRNKTTEISTNNLVFTVTGSAPTTSAPPSPSSTTGSASPSSTPSSTPAPTSVPVGCMGQDRGNFGQLDSPRKGMSGNNNQRLALNIAEGLDHQLVPFVFAPGQAETKDCGSSNKGFIVGAQPDTVSQDGRNCIQGGTGNDGPSIYDGLIGGTGGVPGRLSVSRTGNSTSSLCPGRSNVAVGSSMINNDLLSCFLRTKADGTKYTLADIAQSEGVTEEMLDPAVLNSPRMVWLPVVYASDRAQKNFQPVLEFVPAFITDETQTAGASANNGLQVNGNSVKTMNVFVLSKDALPLDFRAPTVNYNPNGLLRSIVRLVD